MHLSDSAVMDKHSVSLPVDSPKQKEEQLPHHSVLKERFVVDGTHWHCYHEEFRACACLWVFGRAPMNSSRIWSESATGAGELDTMLGAFGLEGV